MKRYVLILGILALTPLSALAHEQQTFEINGQSYSFTIGSLNEPVTVDDKSGVDLRISKVPRSAVADHSAGTPLTGLEETLKVELIAGDKRKVQSLSPVYNMPGAYKTTFFPTVATTLTYRVFGELEGKQIDLSFSCSPAGHTVAEESTERVQIAQNVVRVFKTGSYGCPAEKSDLGFPESSAELSTLKVAPPNERITYAALILAMLALMATFVRRRA